MTVGAVDIGTNSMRLLIIGPATEIGRWVEVTGLGEGVDATGRLSERAMSDTIEVLAGFGRLMDRHGVIRRGAIATSACRDASNREEFFEKAGAVLGVRPVLISGKREASLAYTGATSGVDLPGPVLVSDIGGGSTEFVTSRGSVSVDIGSVRLTERHLPRRPADASEMTEARQVVAEMFSGVSLGACQTLVGVAGTWTSLAAMSLGLPVYDRNRVHLSRISSTDLAGLADRLSRLTVEETAAIPSLDPKRAKVILAGAVIAGAVARVVGADTVVVSEHDTLDALAAELLALS